MTESWTNLKERSNPFTLRLICWVALNMGRPFARFWLYPISLYFFITSRTVRHALQGYWLRLSGKSPSNVRILKHIFCFSSTVLDRVYFLTDQFDKFDIRIDNQELLFELQKRKSGAIILCSHVGSFEVLRSLALDRYNVPLKILMHRNHNQMINQVLDSLNPAVAQSVIDLQDPNSLLKIRDSIENGEFVGMMADRIIGDEKKAICHFIGDLAKFPTGPYELAMLLKVPVIMVTGVNEGGNKYHISFKKLSDVVALESRKNRKLHADKMAKEYARNLERVLRISPYNWFNFYDFWS